MQTLIDHLVSIVIGSVVLLALSVTQMRSSHAGIEQVASHGLKAKTLVFGNWIERDILDIGANMGRNRYRFEAPVLDSLGNTERFTFYSDSIVAAPLTLGNGVSLVAGDTLRLHTRYRLLPTGTAQLRDTLGGFVTRQLYQLQREVTQSKVVNETSPTPDEDDWAPDRWTIATLSFFEIGLLLRDGSVTTDVTRADYIRVRFAVLPEYILNPENYIREIYWATTLKVRPFWDPPPEV